MSHVAGDSVEGRPAGAGYIVQVSAWDLSLLWHARLGLA
jgi:hypothetical protein